MYQPPIKRHRRSVPSSVIQEEAPQPAPPTAEEQSLVETPAPVEEEQAEPEPVKTKRKTRKE